MMENTTLWSNEQVKVAVRTFFGDQEAKGAAQKINMDKPKEPGYSAISSTEISSEEGNVPPGRDEVGEDIDGLDLLPLVVDEP